jgi:DNA repair exonuclease SbcCD ATPase subunit
MRRAVADEEEWEDVAAPEITEPALSATAEVRGCSPGASREQDSGASFDSKTLRSETDDASRAHVLAATGAEEGHSPRTDAKERDSGAGSYGSQVGPGRLPSPRPSLEAAENAQELYQEAQRLSKLVYERDQQVQAQRKRIRELERLVDSERSRANSTALQLRKEEERVQECQARLQAQLAQLKQAEEQRKHCEQEHVQRSELQTLETRLHELRDEHEAELRSLTRRLAMKAQEQLEIAKSEYRDRLEVLQSQLEHVKALLERTQQEQGRRERQWREEVAQARAHVSELEQQNEELSRSVSEATKPLMRQIQVLHEQLRQRSAGEATIQERLEQQVLQIRAELEAANVARAALLEEHTRLDTRARELEWKLRDFVALGSTLREQRVAAAKVLSQIRTCCAQLRRTLFTFREDWLRLQRAYESEARETAHALGGLRRRLQIERRQLMTTPSLCEAVPTASQMQPGEASAVQTVRDTPTASLVAGETLDNVSAPEDAVDERHSTPGSSVSAGELLLSGSLPNLVQWTEVQSQLRHRANVIRSLQTELMRREDIIQNLTSEMAQLNEKLESQAAQVKRLDDEIRRMHEREQALLELLGEKEELVQELREDIADMKGIFHEQLEELARQLESARTVACPATSTTTNPSSEV